MESEKEVYLAITYVFFLVESSYLHNISLNLGLIIMVDIKPRPNNDIKKIMKLFLLFDQKKKLFLLRPKKMFFLLISP